MVTILRESGFRFVIYVNDHTPAHVHAIKGQGEAKIDVASGAPDLVWADGLTRADVRRALQIAGENLEFFLKEWNKIHG